MTTYINVPAEVPGRKITVAAVAMAAFILTTAACRNTTSDEKASSPAETSATSLAPLSLEWRDSDLETDASRIGYGSKPKGILARNPEGALVFTPETPRDHIATRFIELAPHEGARSLELTLDVKSPGGDACAGSLQDQAFNFLVTVPCGSVGEHKANATLPASVKTVRLYFQSPKQERVQLPARVTVVEKR